MEEIESRWKKRSRDEEEPMTIQLIFKIAAVGILVSILCQVLRHSGREEQAFLTSFAGLLLVLSWVLPYIYELFNSIKLLFSL
jgi:stage III sporulation protein AC